MRGLACLPPLGWPFMFGFEEEGLAATVGTCPAPPPMATGEAARLPPPEIPRVGKTAPAPLPLAAGAPEVLPTETAGVPLWIPLGGRLAEATGGLFMAVTDCAGEGAAAVTLVG